MILNGKVKKGLGNASFWIKKAEKAIYEKTKMKVFHGTLNIELEEPYEFSNYLIIKGEEYGGTQIVYVQKCTVMDKDAYILRPEQTSHKSNIIEVVSDVNFREFFNLKDEDKIQVKI